MPAAATVSAKDEGGAMILRISLPAVERRAEHIEQTVQAIRRDRDAQRPAAVEHRQAAPEPGGGMQRDGAHAALVEVAVDFEDIALAVESAEQRLVQRRQTVADDIHHRAMHFLNRANRLARHGWGNLFQVGRLH